MPHIQKSIDGLKEYLLKDDIEDKVFIQKTIDELSKEREKLIDFSKSTSFESAKRKIKEYLAIHRTPLFTKTGMSTNDSYLIEGLKVSEYRQLFSAVFEIVNPEDFYENSETKGKLTTCIDYDGVVYQEIYSISEGARILKVNLKEK